jgi:hypothetical protein
VANVYSHEFLRCHAGSAKSYTPPAGFIAVVRWVTSFNASAAIQENAQIYETTSAATFYWRSLTASTLPGAYDSTELRFVFDETQTIQTLLDSDIDLTCAGFLLEAP